MSLRRSWGLQGSWARLRAIDGVIVAIGGAHLGKGAALGLDGGDHFGERFVDRLLVGVGEVGEERF
jgi:hypothetical protein